MQPSRVLSAKRNLLICLDAFGSIYAPARPISHVYAEAGARYGVVTGGIDNAADVQSKFRNAFQGESLRNPNYGSLTGLGAEQWWKNVIRNTFSGFLRPHQAVPSPLVDELYQFYSTAKAYSMYPDAREFFSELRKHRNGEASTCLPEPFEKIIVGIISNSDERVPGILQSLDLHVGPIRLGTTSKTTASSATQPDIEFVVLSYDAQVEKPDRRIFDMTTDLFTKTFGGNEQASLDPDDFEKLYVGDDLEKDYLGARYAGWFSILLDRKGVMRNSRNFRLGRVGLKDKDRKERKVIMARSLLDLSLWEPDLRAKAKAEREQSQSASSTT
ncbi:hypothetical protein ACEQ8H_004538 [Pleosporales sp. CAS-2024a]